jgi:hypothetical protein
MEDLISIGTIGLIKAIESFSPDKGTKLATFAARCIENEILMHLRSLKKTRKDVSLHDPIGTDKEGNGITLIDILGSEADDVADMVQLKIERSKIYHNLDILESRRGKFAIALGGIWLGITMLGAVLAHLRVKDSIGKTMPPVVFLLLIIILTIMNADGLGCSNKMLNGCKGSGKSGSGSLVQNESDARLNSEGDYFHSSEFRVYVTRKNDAFLVINGSNNKVEAK